MSRLAVIGVVIALVAGVGVAPALAANEALERQRLELDIKRLEREAGFWAGFQRWLPAASVFAAFVAAGIGTWRYFDERARDRQRRTEDEITRNVELLIDSGEGHANARAVAALASLNRRAPRSSTEKRDREHRAQVTEVVHALVLDDLVELATADDARKPIICLAWPELHDELLAHPDLVQTIVQRYLDALRAIAVRDKRYVVGVVRDKTRLVSTRRAPSDADARLLLALVAGIERLVGMLPEGASRDAAIAAFRDTAPALGEQLFASPVASA